MSKRYTIEVIGTAEADVSELWPNPTDPTDPTIADLSQLLAGQDPWLNVLDEWLYGNDLTMRITDTKTGEAVEYDPLRYRWKSA